MRKFQIEWTEHNVYGIDIEADGQAEAMEEFWQRINNSDPTLWDDTAVEIGAPQAIKIRELNPHPTLWEEVK